MNKRVLFASTLAFAAGLFGLNNNTYAAEYTASTYSELKNYIESAPAGEETIIKLNADIVMEGGINLASQQNIVIDGQGYAIKQQDGGYAGSFFMNNGPDDSFTLKNLILQGAAGDWEAKWGEYEDSDTGLMVPYIYATEFSSIENRLYGNLVDCSDWNNKFSKFSMDGVTVAGFAANNLIGVQSNEFSFENGEINHNYVINNVIPDMISKSISFTNNTVQANYFGSQFIYFTNSDGEIAIQNDRFYKNWIADSLIELSSQSDAALSNLEISQNNAMDAMIENSYGSYTLERVDITDNRVYSFDGGNGAILNFYNGAIVVKDSRITDNSGAIIYAPVFFQAREEGNSLTLKGDTVIANNTQEYSKYLKTLIDAGQFPPVPLSAGLFVLNLPDDESTSYKTPVSVDDTTRIYGNSSPSHGFGDDLAFVSPRDLADAFELTGFENIADWYIDNANQRYNPASPIAFSDFGGLSGSFDWSIESDSYNALGLKVILPEPEPAPSPEHNPNTVDPIILTTIISTISVTALAGISLKAARR